jgi:hypothetical protein
VGSPSARRTRSRSGLQSAFLQPSRAGLLRRRRPARRICGSGWNAARWRRAERSCRWCRPGA